MDYELTLVPSYGRDYTTATEVLKDWHGGKDFRIACIVSPWDGKYTSKRDIGQFPGQQVKIRYNKLMDFIFVDLKTGEMVADSQEDESEPIADYEEEEERCD